MTSKLVATVMEDYARARLQFAVGTADLASRQQTAQALVNAGAPHLLLPLLQDPAPGTRQAAAQAISRLATHTSTAAAVADESILKPLIADLTKQTPPYQQSALLALRCLLRVPHLFDRVLSSGGIQTALACIQNKVAPVREDASRVLATAAAANAKTAECIVEAGGCDVLISMLTRGGSAGMSGCVGGAKRSAAAALAALCSHSAELTHRVVDCGVLQPLGAAASDSADIKLQRQATLALAAIAHHSEKLAELVAAEDITYEALLQLSHPDQQLRRAASALVRDLCRHSEKLCKLVVEAGGASALELAAGDETGNQETRLSAMIALGFISAHSADLAKSVIAAGGVEAVQRALSTGVASANNRSKHLIGSGVNVADVGCGDYCQSDPPLLSAACWALGQMGRHSAEHAAPVAAAGVLAEILQIWGRAGCPADTRQKTLATLLQVANHTQQLAPLLPLLHSGPPELHSCVARQISKILAVEPRARRLLVTSGGLKVLQSLPAPPGSVLAESVAIINNYFPEELVRYFSPGYTDTLLEMVDEYSPPSDTGVSSRPSRFSRQDRS